jgi:hypothetical protein
LRARSYRTHYGLRSTRWQPWSRRSRTGHCGGLRRSCARGRASRRRFLSRPPDLVIVGSDGGVAADYPHDDGRYCPARE